MNLTFSKGDVFLKNNSERSSKHSEPGRPARTLEARENQLIAAAIDLAEKQLLEGTASSQVITHYLKLGTTRERLEKEILESKKSLLEAQKNSYESSHKIEELYEKALSAMSSYKGEDHDIYDDDEY